MFLISHSLVLLLLIMFTHCLGELFDHSMIRGCTSNSGFKNSILEVDNKGLNKKYDLVARVGFFHSGKSVQSFRNDDVIYFKEFARRLNNISIAMHPYAKHVISILSSDKCLSYIQNRDIVPESHIEYESLFQAVALSSTKTSMRSASSVHRAWIKLPVISDIQAIGNLSGLGVTMLIDFNIKYEGAYSDLSIILSANEVFSILWCYFGDQIQFFSELGHYHIDAHAGNLLLQKRSVDNVTTATWADFGRTSFKQDGDIQLKTSLISIVLITKERAKEHKLGFINELVMQLEHMLLNYNSFNMSAAHALIESYIEKFDLDTMRSVITGVSPGVTKGFDVMITHIHYVNNVMVKLERDNAELLQGNLMRDDTIAKLQRDNAELLQGNMMRDATIAKLQREVANLTQVVNLLLAQYSPRPLSKIADDGDL
jgi:hypothetical protein